MLGFQQTPLDIVSRAKQKCLQPQVKLHVCAAAITRCSAVVISDASVYTDLKLVWEQHMVLRKKM